MTMNTTNNSTPHIIVNGWLTRKYVKGRMRCCFRLFNGSFAETALTNDRHSWAAGGLRIYASTQFKCHTNLVSSDIQGVTLALQNVTCAKNVSQFIEITALQDQETARGKIAICSKIAYGSLSATKVIEWMEAQIYLGVSKVLFYVYNLNSKASDVLRYYQHLGLVDVFHFDIPKMGTFLVFLCKEYH